MPVQAPPCAPSPCSACSAPACTTAWRTTWRGVVARGAPGRHSTAAPACLSTSPATTRTHSSTPTRSTNCASCSPPPDVHGTPHRREPVFSLHTNRNNFFRASVVSGDIAPRLRSGTPRSEHVHATLRGSSVMSLFSTLSLKLRLIITTAALVALGVAVLSAFNFFTVRSSAMATLTESTSGLAKARADGIAEWVKTRAAVVQSLEPATRLSEPLPALIQGVKSGGFDTTYIGYANKTALFSAPQNLPPDWDPTGRPWYKQAEATQGIALTEPYIDAGSKKLVMTFALAVKDAGSTVAVAAADVFMDVVAHSVTAISPTPSSDAFVVSRGGKVLVHKNLELVLKDTVALSPDLSASAISTMVDASTLTPVSINGTPRLLLGKPIAGTDWVLMISLHRGEALAGVTQLLLNSIMGRLERAMQGVASGDGDLTRRLDIQGKDELARIAEAFNQFVEKIRLTLVDIRDTSAS